MLTTHHLMSLLVMCVAVTGTSFSALSTDKVHASTRHLLLAQTWAYSLGLQACTKF